MKFRRPARFVGQAWWDLDDCDGRDGLGGLNFEQRIFEKKSVIFEGDELPTFFDALDGHPSHAWLSNLIFSWPVVSLSFRLWRGDVHNTRHGDLKKAMPETNISEEIVECI
jgi:hypothetical protein